MAAGATEVARATAAAAGEVSGVDTAASAVTAAGKRRRVVKAWLRGPAVGRVEVAKTGGVIDVGPAST